VHHVGILYDQVFTVFRHLTVQCSKTSQDKKAIPDYQTP